MSVKLINSAETVTTLKDGVAWYTNPVLRVSVLSDGRVFNNHTNRFLKKTANGLYSIYYTKGAGNSNPTSYDSLISHMLGLNKVKGEKIELIIPSKGYVIDNMRVVKNAAAWNRRIANDVANAKSNLPADVKSVPVDLHIMETETVEINGFELRVINADHLFITEDDQEFKTREEADAHQLLVDKGKECAQLIVDDKNGAYTLAEKIFALHVPTKKVYKNFAEMLANNVGIVEIGANPIYQFVAVNSMAEFKDIIASESFTYEQAEAITIELRKYIDSSNNLISMLL